MGNITMQNISTLIREMMDSCVMNPNPSIDAISCGYMCVSIVSELQAQGTGPSEQE